MGRGCGCVEITLHRVENRAQEIEVIVVHDARLEVQRSYRAGAPVDGDLGCVGDDVLHHAFQRFCDEHGRHCGYLADVIVGLHHLLDTSDRECGRAATASHGGLEAE